MSCVDHWTFCYKLELIVSGLFIYFLCGCVKEGEMGSFGRLATRAVETNMPVMVQV